MSLWSGQTLLWSLLFNTINNMLSAHHVEAILQPASCGQSNAKRDSLYSAAESQRASLTLPQTYFFFPLVKGDFFLLEFVFAIQQLEDNSGAGVFVWKDFALQTRKRRRKSFCCLAEILIVSCKVLFKPLSNCHFGPVFGIRWDTKLFCLKLFMFTQESCYLILQSAQKQCLQQSVFCCMLISVTPVKLLVDKLPFEITHMCRALFPVCSRG